MPSGIIQSLPRPSAPGHPTVTRGLKSKVMPMQAALESRRRGHPRRCASHALAIQRFAEGSVRAMYVMVVIAHEVARPRRRRKHVGALQPHVASYRRRDRQKGCIDMCIAEQLGQVAWCLPSPIPPQSLYTARGLRQRIAITPSRSLLQTGLV